MTLTLLILCLIQVESGGNDLAIGDNGKAYGVLQCHDIMVQDVNRICGTSYVHEDCFDRQTSIDIAHLYLSYWCSPERLGREPTWEDYAACLNSGPQYFTKWEKTEAYRAKVLLEINKQKGIQ